MAGFTSAENFEELLSAVNRDNSPDGLILLKNAVTDGLLNIEQLTMCSTYFVAGLKCSDSRQTALKGLDAIGESVQRIFSIESLTTKLTTDESNELFHMRFDLSGEGFPALIRSVIENSFGMLVDASDTIKIMSADIIVKFASMFQIKLSPAQSDSLLRVYISAIPWIVGLGNQPSVDLDADEFSGTLLNVLRLTAIGNFSTTMAQEAFEGFWNAVQNPTETTIVMYFAIAHLVLRGDMVGEHGTAARQLAWDFLRVSCPAEWRFDEFPLYLLRRLVGAHLVEQAQIPELVDYAVAASSSSRNENGMSRSNARWILVDATLHYEVPAEKVVDVRSVIAQKMQKGFGGSSRYSSEAVAHKVDLMTQALHKLQQGAL